MVEEILHAVEVAEFYKTSIYDPVFARDWADSSRRLIMVLAAQEGIKRKADSFDDTAEGVSMHSIVWLCQMVGELLTITAASGGMKQADINKVRRFVSDTNPYSAAGRSRRKRRLEKPSKGTVEKALRSMADGIFGSGASKMLNV